MLEQLCGAKKEGRSFLCCEVLANVEQVNDSSEQRPTLSWAYWRFIEDAGFLDDGSFVIIVRTQTFLLFFCERRRHDRRKERKRLIISALSDLSIGRWNTTNNHAKQDTNND